MDVGMKLVGTIAQVSALDFFAINRAESVT